MRFGFPVQRPSTLRPVFVQRWGLVDMTQLGFPNGLGINIDLLSLLDRYYAFFLPETVSDDWRDEANVVTLQQIWGRLKDWLGADMFVPGQPLRKESVVVQTQRVLDILARLYGNSEDKIVVETINQVRQATLTLQGIPAALAPRLTLSETLSLLLIQLESGNIPPHDKPGAVEMIGWLELVMDDAPVVMVTGMNDGFVPSFLTADPFLPDKVRQELGIEDNQRRYARDAYALSAILGTRTDAGPNVTLIGGRQSTEGDPLLPSRLFFATDDLTVARKVTSTNSPAGTSPVKVMAVAVSAITERGDISLIIGRILLYSGLKSCPHSEIQ